MIAGVGVDIVEIRRIEEILAQGDEFLKKILTEEELKALIKRNLRPEYVAGRFAAKEAVSKALGTGFRKFSFKDIVIENDSLGKPIVSLQGGAKEIANKIGNTKVHLSISHGQDNAIAYVVLEVI